jgi:hypothetical protein
MDVYGKAHVAGVEGTITYGALDAKAVLIITKHDYADAEDLSIIRNGAGQVVGLEGVAAEDSMTLTVYPFATTGADNTLANAAKAMALPARPSVVTLSGITEPSTSKFNGEWVYLGGGSVSRSQDITSMTLPLKRFSLVSGLTNTLLCTKISA